MYIKEAASITGVSVRTLHHYDEIGLLTPKTTAQGYRIYTKADLVQLQQILFFKEIGFPLKKIMELLKNPSFDQLEALQLQRKALAEKQQRLAAMILTIDKTIQDVKGEIQMTHEERFRGFDFRQNPYEQEAIEKWGEAAVKKVKANTTALPENQRKSLENDLNQLFQKLSGLMTEAPESKVVQEAVGDWYMYLNKMGDYPPQAFKGLGELYVADERFQQNMDAYAPGFAAFMCAAMSIYADSLK